ncbi:MAG: hypothetical protein H6Q66_1611 [Firmicutes bacterium]|nr:hypothetical protein [Bacillota bacterium]
MKTKYFSNTNHETLDELKIQVSAWIAAHKNIEVIEMKTSGSEKRVPPEFFIRLTYDDKRPAKTVNPSVAKTSRSSR